MFTNPLNRKYQTGGSVDDEGFYNWLKTNVKEFKDYSIDQIKEGVRKMEQTEEGRKASASLKKSYEEYKKSKPSAKSKFADGGKFQDFICKHARGGAMDCGCGGTVIRGEDGIPEVPEINPDSKQSRQVRRSAKRAQDLNGVTRRSTSYIETPEGKWGFEQGDVNGNTTETYFFAPNGSVPTQVDTPWVQKIYTPYGYRIVNGNQNSSGWRTLGPRIEDILREDNEIPSKQVHVAPRISIFPGLTSSGEVTNSLQEGGELTRKQALTGAQWAMGRGISPVSRDTARLAYINAKNALRNNSDLRGRDLRQAAREMISRPPQAPVPEMAQIDFNTLNNGTVLSPIKDPQFIEEPIFTDEELNQMGNQAVNDAMSSLSRNTRNRGNNAIAGAVQHFATIAPSTIGAVNYGGYDTGKFGERVGNYLKAHSTELMAHPIYGTIKGLYNWFKKEDGGVIKGLDGLHLSRKQARELSGLNKGYDRGQFQLAMSNADAALRDNTDLRGRELRQAKRIMVSGITPMERTVTMESSPAELEISLPTAETISNLNPNLELPVREVATPSPTPIPTPTRTKEPSRAAQALDNAVKYFATTAPSTIGAINYEGYRNPVQNFKDMWNHFTGLFKKEDGGVIEKHQDANGKIATSNVTPVGKVTQIRFPKILFGPGHNTVSFKSDDGLVHTWTRYDDGIYAYNSSPSNITKIYSPKAKETKNVRDGLKHTTVTYPIDSALTQKVDALIDDNTKWWE